MKKTILLTLLIFFTAACGGGEEAPAEEFVIDAETGLPLNPETPPTDTQFIVDGTISNMNLTPQTEPEFVIRVESGRTYRVRSQQLADITFEDGEQVGVMNFSQGMRVRATVEAEIGSAGTGNQPILRSSDLTILRE